MQKTKQTFWPNQYVKVVGVTGKLDILVIRAAHEIITAQTDLHKALCYDKTVTSLR